MSDVCSKFTVCVVLCMVLSGCVDSKPKDVVAGKSAVYNENCEQLSSSEGKKACYDLLAGKVPNHQENCELLESHEKIQNCYELRCGMDYNIGSCKKIESDINRRHYVTEAASHYRNASICSILTDSSSVEYCLSKLGQKVEGDKMRGALSDKSAEGCNQIVDKTQRLSCYSQLIKTIKDISICEEILEDNYRDMCLHRVNNGSDKSVCYEITTEMYRNNCFLYVGRYKGDISSCSEITQYATKKACINSVVEAKKDQSLCERHLKDSDKTYCRTLVKNAG